MKTWQCRCKKESPATCTVIVLKKVLIKHMYLLYSGREAVLLRAWNTACTNLSFCVRALVLNRVRTTLALGRRKAHFEDRLVTLFFFLHHSFQIAARTWRELFPQALQPNVSTQEAWVNSSSSGYESDGKDSALSLLGLSSKASMAEQLNQDHYLHVRAEGSIQ